MVGKHWRWTWMSLLLWGVMACAAKGARVEDPSPIAAATTLEQTETVILDTLPKHKWTAETVEPGRIVAFLAVRTHLLRVEIRYDENQVEVKYMDSDNLDEKREGDAVYLHKNAVRWLRNLQQDLAGALAVSAAYPPATSGS